ncbi:MAG: FGGY-family carbohydrate kinase [Eubacterium sp.]|nr:FGGY-family carbohydrate kinase [Candidatus Colimonas fimequi]
MLHVIAYDFGTSGVKTCVFKVGETIELVGSAYGKYDLFIMEDGGAEQDADQWWDAMCQTTRKLMSETQVEPGDIAGISFCSQMQGIVLVDKDGDAVRRPMSYMDQRAGAGMKEVQGHGIEISGANAFMLLKSLRLTSAASTSVKDPVWKYKWVEKNEPDIFAKVDKWLDVKEYLICRATGEKVMTKDSAYATFLYRTRGKWEFSDELCKMYGVHREHLPRVIDSTEAAGRLSEKAAGELGLVEGIPVYGGGGDANLIGVGAGATAVGQTHVYSGTSGWVGTVTDKQVVDIESMIAAIVGVEQGKYTYFAEMETAGKCFEWVKDHLALDEIGIYLKKNNVAEDPESTYNSLYEYMSDVIDDVQPGAGGVIFTPWLHGNRCPFEDPAAAGIFFNIKLDTGKAEMIRAVQEGICYHLRWMLECQDKKVKTSQTIRFVGGGASSPVVCQMLADITGRTVETVHDTQDVGAVGAAMVVAVGCGAFSSIDEAASLIKVKERFTPNEDNKAVYDKTFKVFCELYKSNKKNFQLLNM